MKKIILVSVFSLITIFASAQHQYDSAGVSKPMNVQLIGDSMYLSCDFTVIEKGTPLSKRLALRRRVKRFTQGFLNTVPVPVATDSVQVRIERYINKKYPNW